MPKFIHTEFSIDLSNKGINEQEQSSFFKDRFFTKFTFPFEFKIAKEQDRVFKNLLSHNSSNTQTYFEGYYSHFGKIEKAIMEIKEVQGFQASATIKYGLEELPNADKKISELSLEKFPLTKNVYDYAKGILNKTWPEVTHNFPAIHHPQLKDSGTRWSLFEGVINNYKNGNFIENTYDVQNDVQENRNLMQPMPYVMHVLQKGFEDAGYTLKGDFLNDPEFKKAVMVTLSEFYSNSSADNSKIEIRMNEYDSLIKARNGNEIEQFGYFGESITLPESGRYKIAGNIHLKRKVFFYDEREQDYIEPYHAYIAYNGMVLWSGQIYSGAYVEQIFSLDVNFNYSSTKNPPGLYIRTLTYTEEKGVIVDDGLVADLTVTQLAKYDSNGDLIPTMNSVDEIDLTKSVPDMTFGRFLTALKNWRNLDITPQGKDIYVNYIQEEFRKSKIEDVSEHEVPNPRKIYKRGESYLLKFSKVDSEKYNFNSVFVSQSGYSTEDFVIEKGTKKIIVNGLPLPLKSFEGLTTAHLFLEDRSRVMISLYSGLENGVNTTQDPINLLMLNNYANYYKMWLKFRINSLGFEWTIKLFEHQLRKIGVKTRLFSYNRVHVIKKLSKKQIHDDVWELDISSDSY